MARFNATGIDGLILSFEEFSKLPDGVVDEMLDAGGDVLVEAHKKSLRSHKHIDTGTLESSIKSMKKVNSGSHFILVYPAGRHHTYNRRLVTRQYARSKSGRTYSFGGDKKAASNSEVGFVLEFGARGRNIRPSHWMKTANEGAESKVVAAEMRVYDKWLESINL